MEYEAIKAQRAAILIKVAMAAVILIESVAYQNTKTLNFGSITMTLGVLCLLGGLLSSPYMLTMPVKAWFKQNVSVNPVSSKYFLCAFILLCVGSMMHV
ncbi:hypothetical protein [Alteromonas macleodii]|uniref:Uncharacterized protein n=1 Tax=Alteromonas macleodii TaxID=28108 RepID=A0A6T9XVN6_ALTMA|nr:hypothetical protein [Alteromonas macleodii]CAB9492543.1 conserved membrane protein of unknown function [Alteromonas macleodii]